MKKLCAVLLLSLACQMCWAARILPKDMDIAVLKAYEQRQVELSEDGFSWLKLLTLGQTSKTLALSPAVIVRDEKNLIITYNKLSRHTGKTVAIGRDTSGDIKQIWILTPQESAKFRNTIHQREAKSQ